MVYSRHARFIFPAHVTGKLRQHLGPSGDPGQPKGSGDCKNVDADRATRFASTCVNHFVSPERVSGLEDIIRWNAEFYSVVGSDQ